MRLPSNSVIATAIILALAGCTNPSGDPDPTPVGTSVKLIADDAAAYDYLGRSVSISGDTAIIGTGYDDDGGGQSGSAYIFALSGGTWSQTAKLTASDAAADDYFGEAVSISGDTAIVGAYGDDDGGSSSGSAYIFTRSGGTWAQTAKLTASDAAASEFFGYSVSISEGTAVVGARGGEAAYIFTLSGGSWSQSAKLTASDGASSDSFGWSVSLSGDTAVVGARYHYEGTDRTGAAYVFTLSGGSWSQTAKLIPSDAADGDNFGFSVSISGDAALVGANGDDDNGSGSGSAYVFALSGGSWSQSAKLTADDGAYSDEFGFSVSISGDLAVVGAVYDDDGDTDSGSAYLYELSGGTWSQTDKLTAEDAVSGDNFARSVSVSDDRILVGAVGVSDGGADNGAAYVFEAD